MAAQLPLVLALVICDEVWVDPNSRKMTILGLFGSVAAAEFPHTMPQVCVYACVTECSRDTQLSVRIVDTDEEHPHISDMSVAIHAEDMRSTFQGAFRLKNVTFPSPGEYRVQLLAGDDLLLERRLVALQFGVQS